MTIFRRPDGLYRRVLERLLLPSGVRINGDRPWDIRVRNESFYQRVLRDGILGLGESYLDGWWTCDELEEMTAKLLRSGLQDVYEKKSRRIFSFLRSIIFPLGRLQRAFEVSQDHYDLGNDLFEKMLDRRMIYSCACWEGARTLEEAQENKLDLICRKIGLQPGMTVLDIGCGWGGFAKFAAERYGSHVVGITVSQEQARLAQENCAGLSVEIRLQDYRDVNEKFDRIVSVGMFEHVGHRYYRTYMETANRNLDEEGLFLLQTVGSNRSVKKSNPFLSKYIFPNTNTMIPSIRQIGEAMEGLFVMEDWQNFGADYEKTLLAWHENFKRRWPDLEARYGERFYRMWIFCLLGSAGFFRAREMQVWQIVLSKTGVTGGYRSLCR